WPETAWRPGWSSPVDNIASPWSRRAGSYKSRSCHSGAVRQAGGSPTSTPSPRLQPGFRQTPSMLHIDRDRIDTQPHGPQLLVDDVQVIERVIGANHLAQV